MSTTFFDTTGLAIFPSFSIPDLCPLKRLGSSFTVSTAGRVSINTLKINFSGNSYIAGQSFTFDVDLYTDTGGGAPNTLVGHFVSSFLLTLTAPQAGNNFLFDFSSVLTPQIVTGPGRFWILIHDPTSTGIQVNFVAIPLLPYPAEYTADCSPLINATTNTPVTMLVGGDPVGIGNNRYGVRTFLQPVPGNQIPYRLCVNNNRLHCILPGNDGLFTDFVYYLGRENNQGGYWYRYVVDPSAMISEEDGNLYAGFEDGGVGTLFNLDVANVSTFAGSNINVNVLFPMSKEEINQRKDMFHLRFHVDTGNTALNLTGYTDFGAATAFSLGTITTNGVQQFDILIANSNFNLAKRMALQITGATPYFKLIDWSVDYDARPEPLSFLRLATNYGLAAKKRLRVFPLIIDTRGQNVTVHVIADGVDLGPQTFNTNERTTIYYLVNTDIFATDLIINISATTGNTFEFYEAPSPVNVETLPVPKLFDQIGPIELERIGALIEFRVRMLATTNSITYNVYMDDAIVQSAIPLPVTPNVDKTYGPFKMPKGIQGSVCRIEFLSSNGVFYRWNCKLKFSVGGVKSDIKIVNVQDASTGIQK